MIAVTVANGYKTVTIGYITVTMTVTNLDSIIHHAGTLKGQDPAWLDECVVHFVIEQSSEQQRYDAQRCLRFALLDAKVHCHDDLRDEQAAHNELVQLQCV